MVYQGIDSRDDDDDENKNPFTWNEPHIVLYTATSLATPVYNKQ